MHTIEDAMHLNYFQNFHSYCTQNLTAPRSFDSVLLSSHIQSVVPMIGPLHISLNSKEDLMINYHAFFESLYERIFPHSKLADKPKPWKTSLVLQVTYGGWTLIHAKVKEAFRQWGHQLYAVLLNLFDNYLTLVLSMYGVTFRNSNFQEYYHAMMDVWVYFYCLKRRHYNHRFN